MDALNTPGRAYTDRTAALESSPWVSAYRASPVDPAAELLIPVEGDVEHPLVTILVPAMNEARTIVDFLRWCHEGAARVPGGVEILIADSSEDNTPELCLQNGARVVRVPKRGLGRAYRDALPFARGRYLILGDADCTYDFREIDRFVLELQQGKDFVMGSRYRGSIEPGAMPKLHQYLGIPVTTWLLNLVFSTKFSDIHCGMRALTREAFEAIDLQSDGWEYASEMLVKATRLGLDIGEVPIDFYKDRNGRVSVHKRLGWLSPWLAAWSNIQAMMVHGGNKLARFAAWPLLVVGGILAGLLAIGPVSLFGLNLSLITQAVGVMLFVCGLTLLYGDWTFELLYPYRPQFRQRAWLLLDYDRVMGGVVALFFLGLGLVANYAFHVGGPAWIAHLALTGLLMMAVSVITFIFSLIGIVIREQVRNRRLG